MRKVVRMSCLTMALLLILVAISSPSFGQGSGEVWIKLKWDNGTSTCNIEIQEKGARFKGVCRSGNNPKKCDLDRLTWTVQNENCTAHGFGAWKLQILDAPGHPGCFRPSTSLPLGVVAEIHTTLAPESSGSPLEFCSQDKFGTYWPYVLSLYEDVSGTWVQRDTTDPGAIIFP
jgi:hypothetical protein